MAKQLLMLWLLMVGLASSARPDDDAADSSNAPLRSDSDRRSLRHGNVTTCSFEIIPGRTPQTTVVAGRNGRTPLGKWEEFERSLKEEAPTPNFHLSECTGDNPFDLIGTECHGGTVVIGLFMELQSRQWGRTKSTITCEARSVGSPRFIVKQVGFQYHTDPRKVGFQYDVGRFGPLNDKGQHMFTSVIHSDRLVDNKVKREGSPNFVMPTGGPVSIFVEDRLIESDELIFKPNKSLRDRPSHAIIFRNGAINIYGMSANNNFDNLRNLQCAMLLSNDGNDGRISDGDDILQLCYDKVNPCTYSAAAVTTSGDRHRQRSSAPRSSGNSEELYEDELD